MRWRKGTNDRRRNKSLNREEMRRGKKENGETENGIRKIDFNQFSGLQIGIGGGGRGYRLFFLLRSLLIWA